MFDTFTQNFPRDYTAAYTNRWNIKFLVSLSDSNQYWAGGEGCDFIFGITQRLKRPWFCLCECKQFYVPYVSSTWA